MLADDVYVGRYIIATNPSLANEILQALKPKAENPKYVNHIFNDANNLFKDQCQPNELKEIFIATTYQLYQAVSFLSKRTDFGERACGKLPQGVRDEMARLAGYQSSEMINYVKEGITPFMKPQPKGTPERPFRQKVMLLVDRFLPYSINPNDSQTKLF